MSLEKPTSCRHFLRDILDNIKISPPKGSYSTSRTPIFPLRRLKSRFSKEAISKSYASIKGYSVEYPKSILSCGLRYIPALNRYLKINLGICKRWPGWLCGVVYWELVWALWLWSHDTFGHCHTSFSKADPCAVQPWKKNSSYSWHASFQEHAQPLCMSLWWQRESIPLFLLIVERNGIHLLKLLADSFKVSGMHNRYIVLHTWEFRLIFSPLENVNFFYCLLEGSKSNELGSLFLFSSL